MQQDIFFVLAPFQVLFFLIFNGGGGANDLVSLIDADNYFKSRGIEVSVEKMVEQASKDPTEPKLQIQQLLAIRVLGDDPEEAKADKRVVPLLEQIAEGKKYQDKYGFAKEYAQHALARIKGKAPPAVRAMPKNAVTEALLWFPEQSTMVGSLDLRATTKVASQDTKKLRLTLKKLLPQQFQTELYKFAVNAGNVRVDSISFAYEHDPANQQGGRLYFRVTGLGNQKEIVEFFRNILPQENIQFKERKGPKGEPITILEPQNKNSGPAFAFIGDTDFVFAGYAGNLANHVQVLDNMLEVRAGKKANVTKGPLAKSLKNLPPQAFGMFSGELPEDLRGQLLGPFSPFKAVPKTIHAEAVRTAKEIGIHVRFTMVNAEDAKTFVSNIDDLKEKGIAELKNLPPDIKISEKSVKELSQTLQNFKLKATDSGVSGGVSATEATSRAFLELIEQSLRPRSFGPPGKEKLKKAG
jgi:hypothetical protein